MTLQALNLGLRFLLEMCALASLAAWGFRLSDELLIRIVCGAGIPAIAAIAWGTFRVDGDPGPAPVAVPGLLRLALEGAVFGGAFAALLDIGQVALGLSFLVATVITNIISYRRLARLAGISTLLAPHHAGADRAVECGPHSMDS